MPTPKSRRAPVAAPVQPQQAQPEPKLEVDEQNEPPIVDVAELHRRMKAGDGIGHCKVMGWQLWPSKRRVSDAAIEALATWRPG